MEIKEKKVLLDSELMKPEEFLGGDFNQNLVLAFSKSKIKIWDSLSLILKFCFKFDVIKSAKLSENS